MSYSPYRMRLVEQAEGSLEDRIRDLCARFVATEDISQLHAISAELRSALTEHIERLGKKVAEYPIGMERRTKNGIAE